MKTITAASVCLLAFLIALGIAYSEGDEPVLIESRGKLVSIERDNAPLREILDLLSSEGGLSYACADEILDECTVTVRMKNVLAHEAALAVAMAAGLEIDFTDESNIAVIFEERRKATEEEEEDEIRDVR